MSERQRGDRVTGRRSAYTSDSTNRGVRVRVLFAFCATEFVTLGALIVTLLGGLPALAAEVKPHGWDQESALSLVTSVGAACACFSNVGFGWLGDRTRHSRYGRMPWVVLGVVIGVPAVMLAGRSHSIAELTLWWALAQTGYNATFAGIFAMVSDAATPGERGRVSAWFVASMTAAPVFYLGMTAWPDKTTFVLFDLLPLVSLAVLAVTLPLLWLDVVRRPRQQPAAVPVAPVEKGLAGQFWLLLVMRLLLGLANSTAGLFTAYYLIRRIGMATPEPTLTWTLATAAGAAATGILASVAGARFARRLGRADLPMYAGLALQLAALLILAFGDSRTEYVTGMLLSGFGLGMYGSVDFALLLRVIPRRSSGFWLGLFNVSRAAPQSIIPAIAPTLLAIGSGDLVGVDRSQNYAAFYLMGAAICLASLGCMPALRVRTPEPDLSDLPNVRDLLTATGTGPSRRTDGPARPGTVPAPAADHPVPR